MRKKKEDSFDVMMRENIRSVTAFALSITSNPHIAEEAVQETFIRAWRYWPTFRHESSAVSWLITICRRVVIDMAKKNRVHEQLPENVIDIRDHFASTAIYDMVRELPLPQREVVVLCAVLGFDYDSAATTLNIPIGTVRSRLARAREQLGRQLDEVIAI
ncbi:MAG: sigma-70 family RNA polymerase sigma factor [Actinobacteria bacterium]|nr:sigma-70 family RNA polymerase sigma factor [Actinomycetota bacterium]